MRTKKHLAQDESLRKHLAYQKKHPKLVTEQILITAVVDYTWSNAEPSEHDLHNDLLYRMKKAIHADYPISRFNIMSLNAKVKKK